MPKIKTRDPQDTTLRNVRATKKREATLQERVFRLESALFKLDRRVARLE